MWTSHDATPVAGDDWCDADEDKGSSRHEHPEYRRDHGRGYDDHDDPSSRGQASEGEERLPALPPLREALRAAEEAEFNVLLRALLLLAEKHRIPQVCTDLLQAFSATGAASATDAPWLFQLPLSGSAADSGSEERERDTYTALLPKIRSLCLDAYLGAKQLRVLADLLSVRGVPSSPAASPNAKPSARDGFSLLPCLESLQLCGVTVHFGPGISSSSASWQRKGPVLSEANEAYMALLQALRGHPTLHTLSLRGSGIGPILLPDLQKLVKATPSLCEVDLTGTHLNTSERAGIDAQCLLNRLRQAKGGERTANPQPHSPEWHDALETWLAGMARDIMSASSAEAFAGKRRPTAPTPHVTTACAEGELDDILHTLYGRKPKHNPHRDANGTQQEESLGGRVGEGASAARDGHLSEGSAGGTSSLLGSSGEGNVGEDRWAARGTGDEGSLDSDGDGEEGMWDDEADTEAAAPSHTLVLPFLRYRLPGDDPHVLSRCCMEVIRSAFASADAATRTFLGGRDVPPGVPGPLPHMRRGSLGDHHQPLQGDERASLRRAMAASSLLTAVRATLFPLPPKPRGIFGPHNNNPELRTTAEENYFATLTKQQEQWDVILDKLVSFACPAFLPLAAGGGQRPACVYEEGTLPYWLSFLPPPFAGRATDGNASLCAHIRFNDPAPGNGAAGAEPSPTTGSNDFSASACYIVLPGEFFGEVELLGGTAYHTDTAAAMLESSVITRRLMGDRTRAAHVVKQLQKMRQATAYLVPQHEGHHSSSEAPSAVAVGSSAPATPCAVWQLPLELVFFLLNEPYGQLQTQIASSLRLSRLGRPSGLGCPTMMTMPLALCPMLACLLEPHAVTRRSVRTAGLAAAGAAAIASPESSVIAEADDLHGNLFFLQEGDYTLCTFTVDGKWRERSLLPGNVLVGEAVFARDGEARRRREARAGGEAAAGKKDLAATALTGVGATSVKEAALRQFREAKRRARMAAADACAAAADDSRNAAASSAAPPPANEEAGEQTLCLGRADSVSATGVWRYFTLSAQRYACLPEETRLFLTANSIVVETLKP